jgi:hypothetical protein
MDRWLANGRYYKLNLQSGEHKKKGEQCCNQCA